MCKSQAEGGQRCASHTVVAFNQTLGAYLNRASTVKEELVNQSQDLVAATTLYATTKKGIASIEELIETYSSDPSKVLLVEDLTKALAEGKRQREITKEVEAQIKARNKSEDDIKTEPRKTQSKIVREHAEELDQAIGDAISKLNRPIYRLGESQMITDLDDLEKVINEKSDAAKEAIADAYSRFLRAAKKDLRANPPSIQEMMDIEIKALDNTRGLSEFEYYKKFFEIEDKYNGAPENFVYEVTGHYAGHNFRSGGYDKSLGVFSTLEAACDTPREGLWDTIEITRVEIG